MSPFVERFENVISKIIVIFSWVSGLTIFAMMFLVSCDVIARYFFRNPIKGTMDLGEMMLVLVGFLGMAYTQAEKGHVRIEVLTSRLSKEKQLILDAITSLLSAFIFGMIAIQMACKGLHLLASDEVGPMTNLLFISHIPFIFIGAGGCLLFCLKLGFDARTCLTRYRSLYRTRKQGNGR
jgi:TRAP-type C4-dicarboxylate transport system permease small subunit